MNKKIKNQKSNNNSLERGKYSAMEIAKLLLSYDPKREYFEKGKMTARNEKTNPPTIGNFRLNKMLHICYMLYYSKYGKPLFREDLRAFQWGAIVYKVFMNFIQLSREKLKSQQILVEEEDKKFINKIYCYFKNNSDRELEDFSHSDISWKERAKSEEDEDRMIINEKTKNFYRVVLRHIVKEAELSQ